MEIVRALNDGITAIVATACQVHGLAEQSSLGSYIT